MSQRHFRWYGDEAGRSVIYFHGAPGSVIEVARAHEAARANGVRLAGLERSATDIRLRGEAYFERLAGEVAALAGEAPFEAIGFSLGGFVALRCAPFLKGRLTRLHLVAAPAPLESGDFLKAMAGRRLFEMARRSPDRLKRLARIEGWLSLHAPAVLPAVLFAGAAGADRDLARDATFRAMMQGVLAQGLGAGAASFTRDLAEYVRPWADALAEVEVETHLWQGEADTWTPPAMAEALRRLVPGAAGVTRLPGLSHYSSLFEAVPRILGTAPAR